MTVIASWLGTRLLGKAGPWLLGLMTLFTGCLMGYTGRVMWMEHRARAAHAECTSSFAAHVLDDSRQATRVSERRRAQEIQWQQRMSEIDNAYETEKKTWNKERVALRGDLHAYRLRLRKHWNAAADCSASATPANTRGTDANAVLRIRDAERLVDSAARCDRQVRGLHAAAGVGR